MSSRLVNSTFLVALWVAMMTSINVANGDNSNCSKPLDPGPCRAAFPTWGYQCKTKECTQFLYGGCKGNGNNFESKEDCEAACKKAACPGGTKRQAKQTKPETATAKKPVISRHKIKNPKPKQGKDKKGHISSSESTSDDDVTNESGSSSESISKEHVSASSEEVSSEEEDDHTKSKNGKKTIIKKKRQRKVHRKRTNSEVRHEKTSRSRKSSKS